MKKIIKGLLLALIVIVSMGITSKPSILINVDIDEKLVIEGWMFNDSIWDVDSSNECQETPLIIEDWMLDENYFY